MSRHEHQAGEPLQHPEDPDGVGPAHALEGQVEARVADQEEAEALHGLVERGHPVLVEDEVLVVGVKLDAAEALRVDDARLLGEVRISRVDGRHGQDPPGSDILRPAEDGVELPGPRGDGAKDGDLDARRIHGT